MFACDEPARVTNWTLGALNNTLCTAQGAAPNSLTAKLPLPRVCVCVFRAESLVTHSNQVSLPVLTLHSDTNHSQELHPSGKAELRRTSAFGREKTLLERRLKRGSAPNPA